MLLYYSEIWGHVINVHKPLRQVFFCCVSKIFIQKLKKKTPLSGPVAGLFRFNFSMHKTFFCVSLLNNHLMHNYALYIWPLSSRFDRHRPLQLYTLVWKFFNQCLLCYRFVWNCKNRNYFHSILFVFYRSEEDIPLQLEVLCHLTLKVWSLICSIWHFKIFLHAG